MLEWHTHKPNWHFKKNQQQKKTQKGPVLVDQ